MAKDKKPEPKKHSSHSGGMSFGLEVLLFVVGIFILWVLAGGAKKEPVTNPILTPDNNLVIPTEGY